MWKLEIIFENNGEEKIQHPHGIVLKNGEIFVSDQNQHRVIKFVRQNGKNRLINVIGKQSASGKIVGSLEASRINFPGGLALDSKGRLIVADAWNDGIVLVNFESKIVSELFLPDVTGSPIRLKSPRSIAVDREGKLIVINCDIQVIMKLDMHTGKCIQLKEFKVSRSLPSGLAIDQYNNIYHTGISDGKIHKLDSNFQDLGVVAGSASPGYNSGPALDVHFQNPSGLAFDSHWDLFISDTNSIKKLDMKTNMITTIYEPAGGFPLCMAFDRFGDLLFTEYYGHRIGKLIRPKLPWRVARIVWLGHKKNSSQECLLAKLPHEIVKEILSFCNN